MNAVELLKRARALISEKAHWTRYYRSLSKDHKEVSPLNPKACRFCAEGAMCSAGRKRQPDAAGGWPFLMAAAGEQGCHFPCEVNDNKGHVATLRMFDRAIELAGSPHPVTGE